MVTLSFEFSFLMEERQGSNARTKPVVISKDHSEDHSRRDTDLLSSKTTASAAQPSAALDIGFTALSPETQQLQEAIRQRLVTTVTQKARPQRQHRSSPQHSTSVTRGRSSMDPSETAYAKQNDRNSLAAIEAAQSKLELEKRGKARSKVTGDNEWQLVTSNGTIVTESLDSEDRPLRRTARFKRDSRPSHALKLLPPRSEKGTNATAVTDIRERVTSLQQILEQLERRDEVRAVRSPRSIKQREVLSGLVGASQQPLGSEMGANAPGEQEGEGCGEDWEVV